MDEQYAGSDQPREVGKYRVGKLFLLYGSFEKEDESRCHYGWHHAWKRWTVFENHPEVQFRGCKKCGILQERDQ
jgi:hypothetical protein